MARRPTDPRRSPRAGGESDDSPPAPLADGRGAGGRGGLADARRYTPRGRSIREANLQARGAGRGDPFRPALEVLQGGAEKPRSGRRAPAAGGAGAPGGGTGAGQPAGRSAAAGTRTAKPAAPARTPGAGRAAGSAREGTGREGTGREGTGRAAGSAREQAGRATRAARGGAGTVRAGTVRAGARRGGAARPAAARPIRKPRLAPRLGDPKRRLRLASLLVLVLFTVIAGRLVELQLTDAKAYAARGLHDRLQTVPLAAPRGAIYDRDGAVLAHSVEARYVYADPGLVGDPEASADALSPLLGVPRSELLPKLRPHRYDDGGAVRFEFLARGVDISVGDQVKSLNLPGIGVRPDEKREVPGHDLAANLLGFTGRDMTGLAGLEEGYDDLLRGVEGSRTFEIGDGDLAAEIPGGYRTERPARPGRSLQLTIDRDLQFEVQTILSQRMRQVNATFGAAVVLDVHTGEVLAQASYPGYDAAEPQKSPNQWSDACTGIAVDPGSVAKVMTIGAALQEGVVTPDSTVVVTPTVTKGDTRFADTHPFPAGTRLTLPAVLAFSSNVATIGLADRLGAQRLYEYQRRFGLGRPTGEGLPGESPGLVQPPENWSGSSYGSIPIGNGISVTPLQMAGVYATIANRGVWVAPHLVRATTTPSGASRPAPPAPSHRVLSEANADALRTMLEAVVTVDGATGRRAAVPGYRVAGKTGTGLRVVNGRYVPGEVASFIGMAPADAPRYVIAVFAHSPAGTGGDVSAPAFRDMMAFTLGHYQVPPTGTPVPRFTLTG